MSYEDVKKRAQQTLEATFWVMDREPDMDDLYEQADTLLDEMTDKTKVEIFRDQDENKRLFLARFEFPLYGEDFEFPGAVISGNREDTAGVVDFLAGLPLDVCEMMLMIGELSTKADKCKADAAAMGSVVPEVPDDFFNWLDWNKVVFNLTALPIKNYSQMMANGLAGEPEPANAHWWFRVNLKFYEINQDGAETAVEQKFPVPGEFLALGVKFMPDKPWGKQKSSPFMYAGNFMDTVFYTAGKITAVIEPDDTFTFPRYEVLWRKQTLTMAATDFAEYKVDDRICIMKDVATEKKRQLWKDDDMKTPEDMWQIAPIIFYDLEETL